MKRTIYRQIGSSRYTSRPRQARTASAGPFSSLLAKLAGASDQLQKARRQSRAR